jgi:hypothetical protein
VCRVVVLGGERAAVGGFADRTVDVGALDERVLPRQRGGDATADGACEKQGGEGQAHASGHVAFEYALYWSAVKPVLAIDLVGVVNLVAAVGGFAAIVGLVFVAARPDRDRAAEDEARAHYDRTGSWPDDG